MLSVEVAGDDEVGFRFDGTVRRFVLQRGVWRDAWVATLLPDELV